MIFGLHLADPLNVQMMQMSEKEAEILSTKC